MTKLSLVWLVLVVACGSSDEPLQPSFTFSGELDGRVSWLVDGAESLLVVASLSSSPTVRVAGRATADSGVLQADDRSWALPEEERIDAVAVVDIDADGDDELLVHVVTYPAAADRLRLIDPDRSEVELLWELPTGPERIYSVYNRSLVAAHRAGTSPNDVLAMVSLANVVNPSFDVLTAHALTRAHLQRLRTEPCHTWEECVAPWTVGTGIASMQTHMLEGPSFRLFLVAVSGVAPHVPNRWALQAVDCEALESGVSCEEPRVLAPLPSVGDGTSALQCQSDGCYYVSVPMGASGSELRVASPTLSTSSFAQVPLDDASPIGVRLRPNEVSVIGSGLRGHGFQVVDVENDKVESRVVRLEPGDAEGTLLISNPSRTDLWAVGGHWEGATLHGGVYRFP